MNVPQMDVYEWICAGALLWLVALCVWMCCPRRKEIVPDLESSLFPNQRQAGQAGAERATHYVCVSKATIRKTRNKKSKRVGTLAPGTRVEELSFHVAPDGTTRVRLAQGWVSQHGSEANSTAMGRRNVMP